MFSYLQYIYILENYKSTIYKYSIAYYIYYFTILSKYIGTVDFNISINILILIIFSLVFYQLCNIYA